MTSNPSGSTAVSTVTVRDIWKAKKRISSVIQKTPFIPSPVLSKLTGASVYLKLENMHEIGAFKVRGAANKILSLSPDELRRGVTTFSTGNHGLAVAYMAKKLGIKAVICISERVPKAKVEAIRLMGCQLEIWGTSQDEASQRCYRLQEEQGMTVIHPFDDPYVIAGQGTIGLEIAEELPEVELTIAGLSGGGLLSGVGLALKSVDPNIKVIGVSMEKGAVMHESLKAGKPVVLDEYPTLADSLLGGIGQSNHYTFQMVKKVVDESILIPEEAIAEGMAFMLEHHRMVVEGAAAVGIGALLNHKIDCAGKQIAIVISGRNVDTAVHLTATKKYLGKW